MKQNEEMQAPSRPRSDSRQWLDTKGTQVTLVCQLRGNARKLKHPRRRLSGLGDVTPESAGHLRPPVAATLTLGPLQLQRTPQKTMRVVTPPHWLTGGQ